MTRKTAREIAVQLSYETVMNRMRGEDMLEQHLDPDYFAALAEEDEAYAEYPDPAQLAYIRRVAGGVAEHAAELDGYIAKYAKNWKFERISKVAAAIMRVAMFEMLYVPEVPYKAAANEAVEITKLYEEPSVTAFVNGILASFIREELGT